MKSRNRWHCIPLETLCGQIMVAGKITVSDRYQIRSALLNDTLSEPEQILINRLLYGIRHGLLRIID
jgi:hypothetical protein